MKKARNLLASSILLALASWVIPILALAALPIQYLYTHLHEISHALVAVATGGTGVTIRVFADGSGVTTSFGGWQLLVSPAGYVGGTIFGAAILFWSRSAEGARKALSSIAVVLGIGLLLWIRGDLFGLISAVLGIAGLALAAKYLKGDALAFCGQFIGAYLSLASLQAVFSIFGFGSMAMQVNDAVILEQATGIPAALSALLWAGVSVTVVVAMLIRAWKDV